jgi:RND family efflux transporter MFP subunit
VKRQQGKVWIDFLFNRRQAPKTRRSAINRTSFSPCGIGPVLCLGAILVLISACGKEEPIVEEIRSLKTITVGETTTGQVRKFSGIVRAVNRSGLSFQVPGNVRVVNVDIGARVKKGQVLAKLDQEPYELEVDKAEAQLVTAEANTEKQQAEYKRQKNLFPKGATSKRMLERAEFALKAAEASVDSADSTLKLAKRDLSMTVLYAPYDGSIGARDVEPFVEVPRGQKLFEIDAEGVQEITVNIPEIIVHLVTVDMPVAVSFPTQPGKIIQGRVTEVGTLAGEGNAFPVKVRLVDPPPQVRSGMTAEATFELKGADFAEGYPIPGTAIKPTTEANSGFVFVYQPDTSTVKQSPIRWRGVKDNVIIVTEGVSPGDILAVAGASFLSDGMKVKLMPETQAEKPELGPFDVERCPPGDRP